MAHFYGTWGLDSQDGFEEYMRHIGVGFFLRKMGNTLKPDFIVSKDEDETWKMVTSSTFKTTEVTFKEGVEFEEKTADDRTVNSTISFDGDKMIHNQVDPNNEKNNTVIERKVDGDVLVTTVTCGDVKAVRNYKKRQ